MSIKVKLRVKEVAESKGIKKAKLSRVADMAEATLDVIWKNPYHDVQMSTLIRIANAINIIVGTEEIALTDLFVQEVDGFALFTPKETKQP